MSNAFTAIVADPFGNLLDEITPALSEVSWVLNDLGAVKIVMSTSDAKWRQDYFRQGGMLLLEFENGLPAWGGVSSGAQRIRWLTGGLAEVNYLSAEVILSRRRSGKNVVFSGVSAGEIAVSLLEATNGKKATGLAAGEVWVSSPAAGREYHYDFLYEAFVKLRESTGGDWGVTAGRTTTLNQQRLDLRVNFWERRGTDKPNVALIEGHNATVVEYVEQDNGLANDWVTVGGGEDWSDERLEGTASDADSIAANNLLEGVEIANDITEQGDLDTLAATRLQASLQPFRALTLDVVDLAPGLFADYDIGDRVAVLCHSVGWGGVDELGRMTARSFNAGTGVCRVVLELDVSATSGVGK